MKRQNLLFSATMPNEVIKLSEEFLEFPEIVEASPSATAAETVTQLGYQLPNFRTKIHLLEYLLAESAANFNKVIVFVRTKKVADNIYKYLARSVDGEIRVIHGNKGQNTRMNSLNAFKSGEIRVLVSTDVAARGIDVSMVSHVINFEVPVVYEDYVHRIGRTGRAKNLGVAITLFTPAEEYHVRKIEKLINQQIDLQPLPDGVTISETTFEEQQSQKRAIDHQRQLEDPSFKGAFHKKAEKNRKSKRPGKRRKRG